MQDFVNRCLKLPRFWRFVILYPVFTVSCLWSFVRDVVKEVWWNLTSLCSDVWDLVDKLNHEIKDLRWERDEAIRDYKNIMDYEEYRKGVSV